MSKFKTPDALSPISVADVTEIVEEVETERGTKGSRTERIAIRLSQSTVDDIHRIADKLGMRNATTDRIMLPDVIQTAVATMATLLDD